MHGRDVRSGDAGTVGPVAVPISAHPKYKPEPGLRGRMVSRRDFAEVCGVSVRTVARWLNEGLPKVKEGVSRNSAVRIPLIAALMWLEETGRYLSGSGIL